MRKGFTFTRFLIISLPGFKPALVLLAAAFWSSVFAQTPTQIRSWEDKFRNRSRIASAANVKIDTTAGKIDTTLGEISLLSIPDSVATTSNFRLALHGVDNSFLVPAEFAVNDVADIDTVPSLNNVYLVTDSTNKLVFFYDAGNGLSTTPNLAPAALGNPVDAYAYIEGTDRKVIITGASGRVFKVNSANRQIEWPPNPAAPAPFLSPSDAVALADRPEVLICETGRNRLVSVDLASNAMAWQFDGGASKFDTPVDVEFIRGDPSVYLVTDKGNHRVVLVQRVGASGQIVFQFGRTGQAGSDSTSLKLPTDADGLPNGNILICDAGNNRLIEVTRQGKIVYTFAHSLFGLTDADRIPQGTEAHKTLVASKATPTATSVMPKRLSYRSNTNKPFVSAPLQFGPPPRGREVDFDFLRWRGILPAGTTGTRVRLQLRTVQDLSDTTRALWYGPTSTADFYSDTLIAINSVHDGDIFFQFRAYLDTDSLSSTDLTFRLRTPILNLIGVSAHYFRPSPPGTILSKKIEDSSNVIITAWRALEFNTELALAQGHSIQVDVLDSSGTGNPLASFSALAPLNRFAIDPFSVPNLRGRQALRLRATLRTGDPSTFTTPKLMRWAVDWNFIRLGPSRVRFTTANFAEVKEYRLEGVAKDSVYVSVVDPNVLPLRDSVAVTILSAKSKDSLRTFLKVNPVTREAFRSRPGLPLVFLGAADVATRGNRRLEVVDRDTLHVNYVDPLDSLRDRSRFSVLVVRRVRGSLITENFAGTPIDSISIDDSLFVRVVGETDQNNSPAVRDTIGVTVFNPRANDQETVKLLETGANTGNFYSLRGLRFTREVSAPGNGRLAVEGGNIVTVSYVDPNFLLEETPTTKAVTVRTSSIIIGILDVNEAFDFMIAPNPFRAQRNQRLNIRAEVRSGSMTIRQIEIYNLAGEKVRTLTGAQTRLGTNATISSNQGPVDSRGWWDMQSDDGTSVASGTYFAKIHVRLFNSTGGREEEATVLRKIVIIQ